MHKLALSALAALAMALFGPTPAPSTLELPYTITGSVTLYQAPDAAQLAVNIFTLSQGKRLVSDARVTVNGQVIPMVRAGYYSGPGGPLPATGDRIQLTVQVAMRTVINGDIVVQNRLAGHEPAEGEVVSLKLATPLRIAWRFVTTQSRTNVTLFNAASGAKIHESLFVTSGEISLRRSLLPASARIKTCLNVLELGRFSLRGSVTPASSVTLGETRIFYFNTSG